MKLAPRHPKPNDAHQRQLARQVICYDETQLAKPNWVEIETRRRAARLIKTLLIPPRRAKCFYLAQGQFFRISCPEGSQVGDLNLWHAENMQERFFSGKTRAFHGTHVSTGDQLWSVMPWLRPLATLIDNSLDWYGRDEDGAAVHDVIGTRCDPYSHALLHKGASYSHCCHSNLVQALREEFPARDLADLEAMVHDVLNVFMCTGFERVSGAYFMKASPARQGDYVEFYAEQPLLGALSACPGGDCGQEHSSDEPSCYPLQIDIWG